MKQMLKVTEYLNGELLVNARELHSSLLIGRRYSTWIASFILKMNFMERNHFYVRYYDTIKHQFVDKPTRKTCYRVDYYLTISTAIDVVMEQRYCPRKKEVLKYLFSISDTNITLSLDDRRKELKFGDEIIRKLFNGYTVVSQYPVFGGEYRIDWYVEELKLAIEYDESHHSQKSYEDDIRQKRIQEHLKCTFLRYKE